jgi:hypothetical protein
LHAARRACELAPEQCARWFDLGRVHVACEDFASAVDCFAQAVQIDAKLRGRLAQPRHRPQEDRRNRAGFQRIEDGLAETVADAQSQARKLIAFLGAPWDARCLDFHRNERAVQTPSRWQVRQPIYVKSIGRWRHYAEHIPALLEAFP